MSGGGDPKGGIRTIFWDLGGVLLTNGWDVHQRARVLGSLGIDLVDYEARHDAANFFWERGLSTARTFFQKTVFRSDVTNSRLSFEDLWPLVCGESKVLHPVCFEILGRLRDTGLYRMATLNNESRELNAYRLDTFELRQYFDYFICSGYLHEMKPHPDIFRAAIEISGLPAKTSLFIDDKQENCEAAILQGMQAIRFISPEQLNNDLARLGVHAEVTTR